MTAVSDIGAIPAPRDHTPNCRWEPQIAAQVVEAASANKAVFP